jgi:phosphoglycolate phosphatase
MIAAVIFDLDGTLIDGAADLQAAANAVLAEDGLAPIDLATVISFIGNGIPTLTERCYAYRGAVPAELPRRIARFKEIYEQQGHPLTRLMAGVPEALRALAARGYRLGLCTNKDAAPARDILEKLAILDAFDAVIGGDSLPVNKPDPQMLAAAAKGCGTGIARVAYVGDGEVDAAMSAKAGVPFLLFTRGYRKSSVAELAPAAAFADYAELPALVDLLHKA